MQTFCYEIFIDLDIHVHATIYLQILDSLLNVCHHERQFKIVSSRRVAWSFFQLHTSTIGIFNNVLGTSLLCQEHSWNVAPLQPRLFVARWPNNTALFSVKKVQCKTKSEHGIAFVLVFRI